MLDHISLHFAQDIDSRSAAAAFGYDHSYFCRKFRRLFGQCFSEYLNAYRVAQARPLLEEHSVTETALLCGFSSIGYFSRVYKKLTGEPPSSHRP